MNECMTHQATNTRLCRFALGTVEQCYTVFQKLIRYCAVKNTAETRHAKQDQSKKTAYTEAFILVSFTHPCL